MLVVEAVSKVCASMSFFTLTWIISFLQVMLIVSDSQHVYNIISNNINNKDGYLPSSKGVPSGLQEVNKQSLTRV